MKKNKMSDVLKHLVKNKKHKPKKPRNYWTLEKCLEEAEKYKNITEFNKHCRGGRMYLKRNNLDSELEAFYGGKYNRDLNNDQCVYLIFFNKPHRAVYIGRSSSFTRRYNEHTSDKHSSVFQFMNKYNLKRSYFKLQLTEYINIRKASFIEKILIKYMAIFGFDVINRIDGYVVEQKKEN
ncbi:MAG: GIY-YIG nuclease family protein [Tissierellales bacterium]|jgi:predicted GIY-YIG superfamily endonuclease|nr:GIY-YIG nuclease family protein [Tissierellales bacterium]